MKFCHGINEYGDPIWDLGKIVRGRKLYGQCSLALLIHQTEKQLKICMHGSQYQKYHGWFLKIVNTTWLW